MLEDIDLPMGFDDEFESVSDWLESTAGYQIEPA